MKRLATKAEFEALLKLPHKWDKERKGILVTADNGNWLFFPALGYCSSTYMIGVCGSGDYWSATPNGKGSAWYLYFDSYVMSMNYLNCNYGLSVRLVSDEPLVGYIDMGTGIYWAIENYHEGDKIYFTWDEAMAIPDKVNETAGLLMKKDGNTPELNITEILNWEQRRYEIAKVILLRLSKDRGPEFSAQQAVKYADEFIKQLKTTLQ